MLPVALALVGAGLDQYSVLRSSAGSAPEDWRSVIFALLALEDLHGAGEEVVAVIALTVLLSVLAHGLSAGPLSSELHPVARPPQPGRYVTLMPRADGWGRPDEILWDQPGAAAVS